MLIVGGIIPDDDKADGGAPMSSGLSKALTRDRTLARTRAIRAGVASDGHVALALVVCLLSQQSAGDGDLVGPEISSAPRDFGDGEFLQTLKSARAMPESFGECLASIAKRSLPVSPSSWLRPSTSPTTARALATMGASAPAT